VLNPNTHLMISTNEAGNKPIRANHCVVNKG